MRLSQCRCHLKIWFGDLRHTYARQFRPRRRRSSFVSPGIVAHWAGANDMPRRASMLVAALRVNSTTYDRHFVAQIFPSAMQKDTNCNPPSPVGFTQVGRSRCTRGMAPKVSRSRCTTSALVLQVTSAVLVRFLKCSSACTSQLTFHSQSCSAECPWIDGARTLQTPGHRRNLCC
jgi:hypothetical protein